MVLLVENFFKKKLLNSKISVFLATTFAVLIIGLLGVLAINYNSLQKLLKESISFNLIINDSVQELETQQLIKSLILVDGVKSVNYISKVESAKKLINSIGEDFLDLLGENPLQNIIEVKYYADYIETLNIQSQIDKFLVYDQIYDVAYDQEIIFLLERNFKQLGFIFCTLAVFFFIIAFVLINSNIRLTIYSKRFSIKTMQLVGATKYFIQKPFMLTNLIITIFACLTGSILLMLALFLLTDAMPEISNFITWWQVAYILLISSTINILISFFSTWVCVRKYLNLKTDELYI